jgi:hypothetical protein
MLTAPQYTFVINISNTELKTEYTKTIILSYFKKAKYEYYTLHIPFAANQKSR